MSITLKVSTDKMNAAASAVEGYLSKVRSCFDELDGTMRRTSSYWEGAGADHYRSRYESYKTEISQIVARINEQIRDLRNMAGVYDTAERSASQVGMSLPDDVIS